MARFAVSNLVPGSVYIISIYAFNSKGRSDPAVLPAAMLRPAEKQLTSEKGKREYVIHVDKSDRNKTCGDTVQLGYIRYNEMHNWLERCFFSHRVFFFFLTFFYRSYFTFISLFMTKWHISEREKQRMSQMASKSFNFHAFTLWECSHSTCYNCELGRSLSPASLVSLVSLDITRCCAFGWLSLLAFFDVSYFEVLSKNVTATIQITNKLFIFRRFSMRSLCIVCLQFLVQNENATFYIWNHETR